MKILFLIWIVFQLFSSTTSDTNSTTESHTLINSTNLAKPGCNSTCGDLIVPYPFGVGDNSECYMNEGFRIYCNTSVNPPKASIYVDSYTSIKGISDSTLRTTNKVSSTCYNPNGTIYNSFQVSIGYSQKPYTFSEVNKFTVIGCYDYAWLDSRTKFRNMSTGCMVYCTTQGEIAGDECTGNGCCQSSIPHDIFYFKTIVEPWNSDYMIDKRSFDPCTYAFIGEENKFKFNGLTDLSDASFINRTEANVPIVLEWAIGNLTCFEAKETNDYVCQSNSKCVNSSRETGGYRCVCKDGYAGNPYLSPGCIDINECEDPRTYTCNGYCINTQGSYNYTCFRGTTGDAKTQKWLPTCCCQRCKMENIYHSNRDLLTSNILWDCGDFLWYKKEEGNEA